MTKTTKSTKRSSAVKQKKGGLFSKINFKSKKTQFIAVIALIAIMGGSWFTYRSFALNDMTSQFAANMITNGQKIQETRTTSGKNDVTIVAIQGRQNIVWYTGRTVVRGNVYEICATNSGMGLSPKFGLHLQGAVPTSPGNNIVTNLNKETYRKDCRLFVATSSVQNAWVRVDGEGTTTPVRVSTVDFRTQVYNNSVRETSVPAPAPSK